MITEWKVKSSCVFQTFNTNKNCKIHFVCGCGFKKITWKKFVYFNNFNLCTTVNKYTCINSNSSTQKCLLVFSNRHTKKLFTHHKVEKMLQKIYQKIFRGRKAHSLAEGKKFITTPKNSAEKLIESERDIVEDKISSLKINFSGEWTRLKIISHNYLWIIEVFFWWMRNFYVTTFN